MTETIIPAKNNRRSRYRKLYRITLVILVVFLLFNAIIRLLSGPLDRSDNTFIHFHIEENESTKDVAQKLEEKGIVGNSNIFAFISKIMLSSNFKSGDYYLSPSMDSIKISKIMVKGITTPHGFEMPAGYTVKQTADVLQQSGFVNSKQFIEAAEKYDFSGFSFIGDDVKGLEQIEGFLLPDKYSMSKDVDAMMIITTMLNQFDTFFTDTYKARADELGMSTREIIVIASMIEKETSIDKERAKISGVLHNRINLDMEKNLPKIPLCSPSKKSIEAALYPEDVEYIYYVKSEKLDGTHEFTSDESEYQKLLEAYNKTKER